MGWGTRNGWIAGGRIRLRSRNGNDITQQYPELESLPEFLNAKRAILDGEIVVLDPRGHSDFGRVQERMHVRSPSAGAGLACPNDLLRL